MKAVEEFLFLLVIVFSGYSAVAAVVGFLAGEPAAASQYLLVAVLGLVVLPVVRRVIFRATGVNDEDDTDNEELTR